MDPFLVFLSLIGCFAVYRGGRAWQRLTEPKPLEMKQESADDILESYRRSRSERRSKDKASWDESYLNSLPVEEHPDYFELDPGSDEVETFTSKDISGNIVSQWESRTNSRGVPYTLTPDYITGTVKVSTGRISWEVPMTSLGSKYNQTERDKTL